MDRHAMSCCTDCGVPVFGAERASDRAATATATIDPTTSNLLAILSPANPLQKLFPRGASRQSGHVAKLIQRPNNLLRTGPQALPASPSVTYHRDSPAK